MVHLRYPCLLLLLLILVSSGFAQTSSYDPDRLYPPNQLKADLAFFRKELTTVHPALFRYWSKTSFDHLFDSVGQTIDHPMKEDEFLDIITLLNGRVRDGHTMELPSEAAITYSHNKGLFFPFSVADSAGHLYVIENNSNDNSIESNDEIMSFDGTPTPEVLQQLL